MTEINENITFFLNEEEFENDCDVDIHKLQNELNEMNELEVNNFNDDVFMEMKNYELNFSVKQLMLICEYYNLKDIRLNKLKKQEIIEQIVLFEINDENIDIVSRRKELWYYIDELKNDRMMKKFVIWQ